MEMEARLEQFSQLRQMREMRLQEELDTTRAQLAISQSTVSETLTLQQKELHQNAN